MLLYITEEQLPYEVTLVYSNRDRESTAFLDELLELERANENIRVVPTMTDDPGWEGERRRIGPSSCATTSTATSPGTATCSRARRRWSRRSPTSSASPGSPASGSGPSASAATNRTARGRLSPPSHSRAESPLNLR
jgi:hypothetical protein